MTKCDVLFIQEHWLSSSQSSQTDHIHSNILCHAVSGFDNSEVLSGRPYGGCAILWRSDMVARVDTITTNSRRICAIKMSTDKWNILFINVYMPYEDGEDHTEDFCMQLSVIEYIISQNANCHIVIGGDFNVDFSRNWFHTDLLTDFFDKLSLEPSTRHTDNRVDYTHSFNDIRFTVFDFFILFRVPFEKAIVSVDVLYDGDNISDHEPVIMKMC